MTQGSRARPLALYNLLTAGSGRRARGRPWLAYFLLPGLLGFGLFQAWFALRGARPVQRQVELGSRF